MTLYVVATPLGNLEDFSPRAVRTLHESSVVYAEDTRRSRILLDHFGVKKPLVSLHQHNERGRADEVLAALERGEVLALLTDAGTPAVSDPGAELVRIVVEAGHKVVPIPGASALTTALSVAGFARGDASVLFLGFLPTKEKDRQGERARIQGHPGLVVLFEAPHRLGETLAELAALEPERPAVVCRELTKIHEELARGTLQELAARFADEARGEITLVIGPTTRVAEEATDPQVDAALKRCLDAGLSARDAASAVAAVLERSRREVYARCQAITK